jgi:hypothetical protein
MWHGSSNRRVCLTLGLIILVVAAGATRGAADKGTAFSGRHEAMLFAAEFRGVCGPPIYPSFLSSMFTQASAKDKLLITVVHQGETHQVDLSTVAPRDTLVFRLGANPPLVSREAVTYSLVSTSGLTSLPTARIFAEVGSGGELSYKSDKGQNVVLQTDVKSVCWDLDQARAIALAKEAGAPYAILAVLQSEDLTQEVNPSGQMGSQKSAAVRLSLTLVSTRNGAIVGSCSEERRQMDLSLEGAIRAGAKSLAAKCVKSLQEGM